MNRNQIFELVLTKLASSVNPVIVCGHFGLVTNCSEEFIPGIYQDVVGDAGLILSLNLNNSYAGEIPFQTFEMGCDLAKAFSHVRLLVLVKDWITYNGERQDSSKNPRIMSFYKEPKLPTSFQRLLESRNLGNEALVKPPSHLTYHDHPFFFSENALRTVFSQSSVFQAQSCKIGGVCAQDQIPEYAHLVEKEDVDFIVNFLPQGCGEALVEAKLFSKEVFPGLFITNFYCNGAAKPFWEAVHQ